MRQGAREGGGSLDPKLVTAKVQPAGFCTMLLAQTVVCVLVRVILPATSACKEAPALRIGQAKALAFGLPDC